MEGEGLLVREKYTSYIITFFLPECIILHIFATTRYLCSYTNPTFIEAMKRQEQTVRSKMSLENERGTWLFLQPCYSSIFPEIPSTSCLNFLHLQTKKKSCSFSTNNQNEDSSQCLRKGSALKKVGNKKRVLFSSYTMHVTFFHFVMYPAHTTSIIMWHHQNNACHMQPFEYFFLVF